VSHRLQALAILYPEVKIQVTIGGWVGPRADVDIFEQKNTVLPRNQMQDHPEHSLVTLPTVAGDVLLKLCSYDATCIK